MNVLVLDIDSLRLDHVGAYGYGPPTTPHIDGVAADGIRFTRAYAANSPCMPSRAALLSGRFGIHNGVATHGVLGQTLFEPRTREQWTQPTEAFWTLPELLYNERVVTGGISSFPRHPARWFLNLWHEFYTPQEPAERPTAVPRETPPPRGLPGEGFQTPRAEAVVDLARRFVRSHSDDRFFLYTQLWDPHEPYNRCQAEIEPFRDVTPLPPHPTADEIDAHRSWDTVRGATDMNIASRGDVQELLARYDAEIRYADDHVGRLMETLKREELYAETLVVITADHGEEFGEHGSYRHHWSTHDGTQRIPLIIKPPSSVGGPSGASCDALVTNVDVGPTVAACLDIEPPSGWQGRPLTPLVADPDAGRDGAWRPYLVVDHGLYMAQRAVRTDRWKLVKTYHPGLWAEVTPSIQLFDLPADPWEQSNVAADYPDVVARLTGYRREWVDEHRGPAEDSLRRVAREGPAGYRWFTDAFDGM